ncbi:MAG: hypothetical protein MJD61_04555 [Proteobacteria bacterium]|nr:hypothetical protein [Pseudomonadota bacterium]
MRTSLDVPDELLRRAKAYARQRGLTFRELVLQGLRETLDRSEQRKRYVMKDLSVGRGGLLEGLTTSDWEEIRRRAYEGRGG